MKLSVEATDHLRRYTAFWRKFQTLPPPTEHHLKVFARHAELIQPELNGFNRIRKIHDMMLDRGDVPSASGVLDSRDIDRVIVCIRANKTDIDNPIRVIDLRNQTVVIPCNGKATRVS
jgi:hypothetical protein